METTSPATVSRAATLAVIVAALGYFVDIYDLILFGMVRVPSLAELGYQGAAATEPGIFLINMQMGGMLLGGILWGVIGDKRGRLSVLFLSITMYSFANIANGFVHSLNAYAFWRLIAGIGLAGELGAGITLVSELMGKHNRAVGTTIVAALGVSGGVVAGLIGTRLDWRVAYFIGGGMGIALLLLRIGVVESGMFHQTRANKDVVRGNMFALFSNGKRLWRYLAIIFVGIPVWYVIGILFLLAKEIGGALGVDPAPSPATALTYCYGGCAIGGMLSGFLNQAIKSRKKTLAIFMSASALMSAGYFLFGGTSSTVFYVMCALGGAASGYWAVFVSTAAELFGTNLRATVTTTVPNFVRGSTVLLTLGYKALVPNTGIVNAAIAVGVFAFTLGAIGLWSLRETYGVDLDFIEEA